MILLLLLASISWGQTSTDTATSQPLPVAVQADINGTAIAVKNLFNGKPRITGIPNFTKGIMFGDGTTQTTAAAGSSSGATTFAAGSTVTFSTASVTIVGSTITINQIPVVNGLDFIVASTIPVQTDQAIFGGVSYSSGSYRLVAHIRNGGTAQAFGVLLGGDNGAFSYGMGQFYVNFAGSTAAQNAANNAVKCQISFLGTTVDVNQWIDIDLRIHIYDSQGSIWGQLNGAQTGNYTATQTYCRYLNSGSAKPTTITLFGISSGMWRGSVYLYQMADSGN